MEQQTAVEWLIIELNQELNYIPITQWDRIRDIVQRAKQKEKQQIMKAFLDGKVNYRKDWADQYYNKTYNK